MLANPGHTATVAACVSDAIASEIIEAGVVGGGMSKELIPSRVWRDANYASGHQLRDRGWIDFVHLRGTIVRGR